MQCPHGYYTLLTNTVDHLLAVLTREYAVPPTLMILLSDVHDLYTYAISSLQEVTSQESGTATLTV